MFSPVKLAKATAYFLFLPLSLSACKSESKASAVKVDESSFISVPGPISVDSGRLQQTIKLPIDTPQAEVLAMLEAELMKYTTRIAASDMRTKLQGAGPAYSACLESAWTERQIAARPDLFQVSTQFFADRLSCKPDRYNDEHMYCSAGGRTVVTCWGANGTSPAQAESAQEPGNVNAVNEVLQQTCDQVRGSFFPESTSAPAKCSCAGGTFEYVHDVLNSCNTADQ